MELTQQDYEERKGRAEAGTATDDDLRLVKHYERQGYGEPTEPVGVLPPAESELDGSGRGWHGSSSEPSSEQTPKTGASGRNSPRSRAQTTGNRSK